MIESIKKVVAKEGFWRLAVYVAALFGVTISPEDMNVIVTAAIAGAELVSLVLRKVKEYKAAK